MKPVVKQIEGHPNYFVDITGRVWSKKRGSLRLLKATDNTCGYVFVHLCKNGSRKTFCIHKLVAQNFLPPRHGKYGQGRGKYQINHIDGNKLNNSVENLEWCTPKENIRHALDKGLKKPVCGEKQHRAKLNQFKVRRMRLMYEVDPDITHKKIASIFNVTPECVCLVLNKKRWKHVT